MACVLNLYFCRVCAVHGGMALAYLGELGAQLWDLVFFFLYFWMPILAQAISRQ